MDRLSLFLSQFPVSAGVFHSGALPTEADFPDDGLHGHLHVFRSGRFSVYLHGHPDLEIDAPTLLYCPQPIAHRITPHQEDAGDLLCATVRLGSAQSPLIKALPAVIVQNLHELPDLQQVLTLLFNESSAERCGKQVAQDRLAEYFLVLLLRELIDKQSVNSGLLAGLSDKRLAKALIAVQLDPGAQWTLDQMAAQAGMSRARFAAHFRKVIALTPHQYLTDWRISIAQNQLRRGESLQNLAEKVGYSHPAALTRAFQQRVGLTPRAWLKSVSES